MVRIKPRFSIMGELFRPSRLQNETRNLLIDYHDPGALGLSGRYRNLPIPYGSATLLVSETFGEFDLIKSILEIIEKNIIAIRREGADELNLHLDIVHDGQCNFQLDRDIIGRIYNLGIDFTISCWSEDAE